MSDNAARYEFRVWSDRRDEISERLLASSEHVEHRTTTETYLVSTATVAANPKARADLLDIKVLQREVDGFEQWDVHLKAEFPVAAALLRDELFPCLGLPPPPLDRGSYSLSELVDLVVAPHPQAAAVEVIKRRDLRRMEACAAEVTDGRIGDRAFFTVAVESEDLDALRTACAVLGLAGRDNVSYPRAIRDRLGGGFTT